MNDAAGLERMKALGTRKVPLLALAGIDIDTGTVRPTVLELKLITAGAVAGPESDATQVVDPPGVTAVGAQVMPLNVAVE